MRNGVRGEESENAVAKSFESKRPIREIHGSGGENGDPRKEYLDLGAEEKVLELPWREAKERRYSPRDEPRALFHPASGA